MVLRHLALSLRRGDARVCPDHRQVVSLSSISVMVKDVSQRLREISKRVQAAWILQSPPSPWIPTFGERFLHDHMFMFSNLILAVQRPGSFPPRQITNYFPLNVGIHGDGGLCTRVRNPLAKF